MLDLEPAHYLADNLRFVPRGRALDIAMGNGRNTVYLAKMGFDVEGIDLSLGLDRISGSLGVFTC